MPRSKVKIVSDACCKIPNAHLPNVLRKGHSACATLLLDDNDNQIDQFSKYLGEMTPPQAEYNGIIFALDKAAEICRGSVEVWTDSEFVVKQLNGEYGIKSENMKPLFHQVKTLEQRFGNGVKYFHHRREAVLAQTADQLANKKLRDSRGE